MSRWLATLLARTRCAFSSPVPQERAIQLAREEMERRGGRSQTSVQVRDGLFCYTVFFASDSIGGAFVKIDKFDGSVRHVGIPPP